MLLLTRECDVKWLVLATEAGFDIE